MSFSGTVSSESHEGGLLISFEGRAPKLGAGIRITGGKTLGRVETVLGPIEGPLVHVHPLNESIDAVSAIGSPVEIAPRGRVNRGRQDRRSGERKFRRGRDSRSGGRRGNEQRGRKTTIMQTEKSAIELVVKSRNQEVGVGAEILVAIDLVTQVVSEIQI